MPDAMVPDHSATKTSSISMSKHNHPHREGGTPYIGTETGFISQNDFTVVSNTHNASVAVYALIHLMPVSCSHFYTRLYSSNSLTVSVYMMQ